jgi:hypothetical protein
MDQSEGGILRCATGLGAPSLKYPAEALQVLLKTLGAILGRHTNTIRQRCRFRTELVSLGI